jgi:hypothetical protein
MTPASAYRALQEIAEAPERITRLEDEIRDCRELNRRLADITDLAAELLIPVCDRDDDRLRRMMMRARAAR